MPQTIQSTLSEASFYSDEQSYVFIKLPAQAITIAAGIVAETGIPFCALLVDKDEVSLMIPEDAYEEFQKRLKHGTISETRYRLITIDVELEATLIGFMAIISQALAIAGITIMPFAAYSRDHLFVPSAQFQSAIQALEALKSNQ